MRRNAVGVNALNAELQSALNPPSPDKQEQKYGMRTFREGDKVMQIKNNYNIEWEDGGFVGVGVFNGDVGYIENISHHDDLLTVLFDETKRVEYDFSQLEELELAYAVTIHKSQGSEFEAVIMPLYATAPMLKNRNLLYTGVTRAKGLCILVGKESEIQRMTETESDNLRYSALDSRLRQIAKEEDMRP
jgi:exodeoxyribonuclease V alpha subunit